MINMKTISFKANIILKYKPRTDQENSINLTQIKELFENGKIDLEEFAINWFTDEFEPGIIIKEVED